MNYSKLILVEQYFRLNSYDFNKDERFSIIKRNLKTALNDITTIIERHEGKWIKRS